MLNIPQDPRKIRARIRSYERKLADEKRLSGMYGDGAGKRFLLGPIYMAMGYQAGALESSAGTSWSSPTMAASRCSFSAGLYACTAPGTKRPPSKKLRETMLENLYIIPLLLSEDYELIDMWHGSNKEEPEWAEMTPPEFLALWSGPEKQWASDHYHGP